ncbi:MAG TPA: DUF2721 domain-containing protein [Bacteriovoracaceae bacterium]|nr:DUF2721 domain-containing protein [Bacteriovoracaceae bacterium]
MNPKDLAVLSAMITPAVLIMASSSLILATSQRLSRIMDRARKMNDHVKHINNDESLTQIENNVYEILHYTLNRAVILQRTLSYLYISLTTFVATSTSIGFIDITHVGRVWIPILLSVIGVSLLLISSLLLIRESRIALTSVKKETELIRLMNQRYFQKKRKRRMLRGGLL